MIKYKDGDTWKDAVLDYYPVGALYFSFSNTSPANLFGGSWSELNSPGRLIGVHGGNGLEVVEGGQYGGHNALEPQDIPAHSHKFLFWDNAGSLSGQGFYSSHFETNNTYHFYGYNSSFAKTGYLDEHLYEYVGGGSYSKKFLPLVLRNLYLGESGIALQEVISNE